MRPLAGQFDVQNAGSHADSCPTHIQYLLVATTLLGDVALSTLQLENLGTLGRIARRSISEARHSNYQV